MPQGRRNGGLCEEGAFGQPCGEENRLTKEIGLRPRLRGEEPLSAREERPRVGEPLPCGPGRGQRRSAPPPLRAVRAAVSAGEGPGRARGSGTASSCAGWAAGGGRSAVRPGPEPEPEPELELEDLRQKSKFLPLLLSRSKLRDGRGGAVARVPCELVPQVKTAERSVLLPQGRSLAAM